MEVECVVWCPSCREDKYEVRRVPTGNRNVFQHETFPESLSEFARKTCDCGTNLERKS